MSPHAAGTGVRGAGGAAWDSAQLIPVFSSSCHKGQQKKPHEYRIPQTVGLRILSKEIPYAKEVSGL